MARLRAALRLRPVRPLDGPLVTAMATTVEQTLLDLADLPGLGVVDPRRVGEATGGLSVRADWDEPLELARRQRLHAAHLRARWVASRVLPEPLPAWPGRMPRIGDPDAPA
jgi:hypothetical protein